MLVRSAAQCGGRSNIGHCNVQSRARLNGVLRHQALVADEQFREMLVHRPHAARTNGSCSLKLRPIVDERLDRMFERPFVRRPIDRPCPPYVMIQCGAAVRNDTVFVSRILALAPQEADSMSISSAGSVERCGPPEWSGTVHTHVALYTAERPSTRFSAQDRGVMRQWYERWHADGVFCLVYSARDAHCEADGVVGGMRSRPILVR